MEAKVREEQRNAQAMQSGVAAPPKVSLKEERVGPARFTPQAKELIGGVLEDVKMAKALMLKSLLTWPMS